LIISGVKTTAFPHPRSESSDPLPACLVELQTDNGQTGIAIGAPDIARVIEQIVQQQLSGTDPRAAIMLWADMVAAGANPGAIAALDIALWDLKAKVDGEPLWKTLGGSRPRANAYAGEPHSIPATAGFHEGKLNLSADFEDDIRRLGEMREALSAGGREPVLMIDAGESWTADEAIRKISRIEEEYDLTWIEAPVPVSDIDGLRRVSDNVAAAVCAGGSLCEAPGYLPLFRSMALDVVQIDISRTGITGALQIADTAYGLELPVTLCASPGNMAAHVAAVMPNFMSLEITDTRRANAVLGTDVRIEAGRAIAGDAVGNGLSIDSGALA
jgi:L-alanine-DL-glutamate epimerase-like enolase superfamily enzyme